MINQPNIEPISVTDIERKLYGIDRDEAYRLEEQFEHVFLDATNTYKRIIVPAGLIYDGASVPRGTWTVSGILPDGLIRAAALVHDYIYINGGAMPAGTYQTHLGHSGEWIPCRAPIKRGVADSLFCEIMKLAGMPSWKVRVSWVAVRSFGWASWGSRVGKTHIHTGARNNAE